MCSPSSRPPKGTPPAISPAGGWQWRPAEGTQRYRVLDVAYSPWGDIVTVEGSGDWLRLGAGATCGAAALHTPAGAVLGTYSFTGGDVDPATYQMVMRGGFRPV